MDGRSGVVAAAGRETWARRLAVAVPLVIGLALIAVFVLLLLHAGTPEQAPVTDAAPASPPAETHDPRFPVPPSEIPRGSPTAPGRERPRAAPGTKRWVIDPLPAGWDPELAAELARLFALIDYDPSNPESFLPAGKAWDELKAFLAELGPDALPTLAAILNAESAYVLRLQLLDAIGNMGESEAATFILRDYFVKRAGDLAARAEMNHVIKAIGALKNDTAYETMLEFIDSEKMPPYYKDKFIVELGEHPRREEQKDLFKTMMIESRSQNLRNHSAQALGKFGDRGDLPDLYDAYDRERRRGHWMIRQTILGTIGKIGDPSAIPFLEEEARFAKEDGVRLSAASALRRIGTPAAYEVLAELAGTEPSAAVRSRIKGWLSRR